RAPQRAQHLPLRHSPRGRRRQARPRARATRRARPEARGRAGARAPRRPRRGRARRPGHSLMSTLDFDRFDALTFDCYGTLIDWERGILDALQPVLAPREVDTGEEELLELYAAHEAELEAGPYLSYREVVGAALHRLVADLGHEASYEESGEFADAVG